MLYLSTYCVKCAVCIELAFSLLVSCCPPGKSSEIGLKVVVAAVLSIYTNLNTGL